MKRLPASLLVLGAAAFPLLWSSSARAQYFVNGDFESIASGLASGGAVGSTTGSSTSSIQGWSTTLGHSTAANVYVNEINTTTQGWIPNPESGNYCVQLDGSSADNDANFATDSSTTKQDSISQLFTEPVGTYTLAFYLDNEVGNNKGGTSGALVSLVGVANGTFTNVEYKVTNPASPTKTSSVWTRFSTTFTVTDASAPITLTFADDPNTSLANYTKSSNIAIDNVSVASVPEPSAIVGLVAGFAGLCGLRRVRRRRAC